MRTKVIMTICLFLLMAGKASAQWSVIDPTNIAQSIINSSNNIVHTSSTAQNMINNFKETLYFLLSVLTFVSSSYNFSRFPY